MTRLCNGVMLAGMMAVASAAYGQDGGNAIALHAAAQGEVIPNSSGMSPSIPSFSVSNKIEEMYDEDQNGRLEDLEVLIFLRDVVKAVSHKGRFFVVSSVLAPYDQNSDGRITRPEAEAIEAFLY